MGRIHNPKFRHELKVLEIEIEKLAEINAAKEHLLDRLNASISGKKAQIEKKKQEQKDVGGTWVADSIRKKLVRRLELKRAKVAAVAKQRDIVQSRDKDLRAQIDNLRREKLIYVTAFKRMQEELRTTTDHVEASNQQLDRAYRARDKAGQRVTKLHR